MTGSLATCFIGSCHRHQACMYSPCRAPGHTDTQHRQISPADQRLILEALQPIIQRKNRTQPANPFDAAKHYGNYRAYAIAHGLMPVHLEDWLPHFRTAWATNP